MRTATLTHPAIQQPVGLQYPKQSPLKLLGNTVLLASILLCVSGQRVQADETDNLEVNVSVPLQIADQGHQHHGEMQSDLDHSGMDHSGMDHGSMDHGDMHGSDMHHHGELEIIAGQPVPAVQLLVNPDTMRGWNVELQIENFEFAPERVNQGSSTAEGHAHLYVNGKKLARLYSSWYHIDSLPPGRHEITVSLNSNNHETLTYQGEAIADTIIVEVPE